MPTFEIGPSDGLYYEYTEPSADDGCTFVFFNALTGSAAMWQADLVPALSAAGHGALIYNMRGQENSPFTPGTPLDEALITQDAMELLMEVAPPKPVFVGLSIGGLFAARTYQLGAEAEGIVFINTLRKEGPRLSWQNDAVVRVAEVGGLPLLGDLFSQLLWGEPWLEANRANFFDESRYAPIDKASGHYSLLDNARTADWNLHYERIELPVLILTGKQDHVFYEEDAVAELTARLPDATRVDIPDGGHMLPVEQPQKTIDALLEFAKKI